MFIQVPVTTEVIEKNEDLRPSGRAEDKRLIIEFDTRKRNYHKLLNLKRKVKISWTDERTFDVQELSGLAWPIVYRVTTATGYYSGTAGERVYFTPQIEGLSTQRKVSDVVNGYTKSISFLEEHFKNMTTFLRVPGVKRNSLAETGMRVLRRLERNHDGFRSEKGRQNALKIYQAVTYLGWSIHNPTNLTTGAG